MTPTAIDLAPSLSIGIGFTFLACGMIVQGLNGLKRQLEAAVALPGLGIAAS
jgi:hypothetical protein